MRAIAQRITAIAGFTVLCTGASFSYAADTVMVGGAAMYPNKTIVENAVNSKDHTTLVAAVKAAGLVDTLNGKGPFTVFAPTNAAFDPPKAWLSLTRRRAMRCVAALRSGTAKQRRAWLYGVARSARRVGHSFGSNDP